MTTAEKEDIVRANIEKVLAIETLEYHNMNYLSGDIKKRNEVKRDLLLECLTILGTTATNSI
jgi:hypothetical protein